jgi:hypothetical protein
MKQEKNLVRKIKVGKTTYTVDESLNNLKPSPFAIKKLEQANAILRNVKTPLPK